MSTTPAPFELTPATLRDFRPEPGYDHYAILGDPVAHSLSPVMQTAAFEASGGLARYGRIQCPEKELEGVVGLLREKGFRGWNCTVPLKVEMHRLISRNAPSAEEAGAVNTVIVEDGDLIGYSTDGLGFENAAIDAFGKPLEELRLLILGAGGSGQTIAIHASTLGCREVYLSNRSVEKATAIADLLRRREMPPCQVVPWEPCALAETAERVDLIVNTTSVGLKPGDPSPVSSAIFREGLLAYDLIYNPAETPFLAAAKTAGARTANGLGMLLSQGFLAFQIWNPDLSPPRQVRSLVAMRGALEQATGQSFSSAE